VARNVTPVARRGTKDGHPFAAGMAFIAPFAVLYLVFTIWPVFQGFWVSLHKWGLMGKQAFIGVDNYTKLLGDKYFWGALSNTTRFTAMAVPALMFFALLCALAANRSSGFKKFLRSSYYMPSVLSVSVASFIAMYMAAPYLGFVNEFLHTIGVLAPGQEPQWLMGKNLVWVTLVVTTVWWTLGFSMLLYLAALQEIPDEIMEAAAIDGANPRQQFFQITLPLLSRTHYLVFLLQGIACYKVFGQIQLMTNGGPGTSTRSLVQYIQQTGFAKNNMGYAAAMSFGLFLILLVFSILQIRVQSRGEKE